MKLLEVGRVELENEHGARAEIYKSKNVYDKDVFIMDLMIKNEALPIPFYEIDKLNIYLKSLGFKDVIEKPFDLIGFLKNNLTVTKFCCGETNQYLVYDFYKSRLNFEYEKVKEITGTCYFKLFKTDKQCSEVLGVLNSNKITPQQLKEAYKQLGWL